MKKEGALLTIIMACAFASLLITYYVSGPSWDLMAHFINARAMLGNFVANTAYFELFRAPLSSTIMAIVDLAFQNPIIPYLSLLFVGLSYALYRFGKSTGTNVTLLTAFFLNFYVISFFFIPNSTEALSVIFLLLGVSMLVEKNPISGLFFGLAAISKYPTMIFLPMVLLLPKKKDIYKALALEFLPMLPWFIFNFMVAGNPIQSYLFSISGVVLAAKGYSFNTSAIFNILEYPVAAAAFVLVLAAVFKSNFDNKSLFKLDRIHKILIVFLALSFVEFLYVSGRYEAYTQMRFGYIFATALICYEANRSSIISGNSKRFLSAITVLMLALLAMGTIQYALNNASYFALYNPLAPHSVFASAKLQVSSLYPNCSIRSNAWPYLLYIGQSTYPTINTTNSEMAANIVRIFYNRSTVLPVAYSDMPTLYFKDIGLPISFTKTPVYNGTYFAIYSPANSVCN